METDPYLHTQVLDYTEGEQTADHAEAAAADAAEEPLHAEAAENGTADGDAQMQVWTFAAH